VCSFEVDTWFALGLTRSWPCGCHMCDYVVDTLVMTWRHISDDVCFSS
jgi:hypothetical protein